ncbi:MAG: hypothetical protein KC486_11725, partial [Myxococcales bacterium]|nr:hypothetical protein [Myxococcales bacterium]
RFLDDYAEDWLGARARACEDTRAGRGSEELLELRLRCLERRVERAQALVRELEGGVPALLEDMSVTMPALPAVASCLEATRPAGAERAVHEVELQLTADNYWSGAFDGVPFTAANAMEWRQRDTIVWFVPPGRHTIAVDVVDIGTAAGFIATVRVDGALVSGTGDGRWRLADGTAPARCAAVSPVIAWAGSAFLHDGAAWIWDDAACSSFHTPSFALTLDL